MMSGRGSKMEEKKKKGRRRKKGKERKGNEKRQGLKGHRTGDRGRGLCG
jgi:hypothetical protein